MAPTQAETAESPFRKDALRGRVALVSGGGSGIGLGIATRMGEHGAKLVLMGRREGFLAAARDSLVKKGIEVEIVAGDVRSEADAKRAVDVALQRFGRLDTLINCAAGNFLTLPEQLTVKGFTTVMEIDAIGTFNLSRQAFDALRDSKDGRIINITATLHQPATWYVVHASAAKAAVDALTRQLALEWGQHGIRVNGIAPGPIKDTPGFVKLSGPGDAASKGVVQQIPLGRAGTVEEMGDVAVFLLSSAGNYVSGHTVVADGGQMLWSPPMAPREAVTKFSREIEPKSREVGKAKL